MKIEVYTSELKKALNIVYKGVSAKPHLPILSGILLKVRNGKTSFTSTDLEVSFWIEIETTIEEEGELVIPAKLFIDLISTLEEGRILLESVDSKLKIVAKGLSTEILCQPAEDFPVVPRLSSGAIKLNSNEFRRRMDKVMVSSAKDDTRPILTGILFGFKEGLLTLVATDGFRLSVNSLNVSGTDNNISVIIPAKSIGELLKAVTELSVETIVLDVDKQAKQVVFGFGGVEMSSRILDGEFPPYQQIIPNTYSTKVSFLKQELITAVKRASLFAKDSANVIKVSVEDKLLVMAENSQIGSNVTDLEAEVEGEKLNVAFNARYLLDFLPVVEGDYVEWETEGELKPSVFRDKKDNGWLQVVMPIRIQS